MATQQELYTRLMLLENKYGGQALEELGIGQPNFALKAKEVSDALDETLTIQIEDKSAEIVLNKDRVIKLSYLKKNRIPLYEEADSQIRMHEDLDINAIATVGDWRNYRILLRDITDDYKDYATNTTHATDLDALDVTTFIYPTKPS